MSNQGNQNQNTAVTVTAQKQANLKTMLVKAMPSLKGIASKAIDPERLMRIALVASSRRPELLNCTPQSILSSLLQAAQMGLEPETPHQHAYLIPYFNSKTGQTEAQFQESYRGLLLVATRNGIVVHAHSNLVYANEQYMIDEGLHRELKHTPVYDEESRGDFILTYCVAKLKQGDMDFEVMTKNQVNKIRARSKASAKGPWVDDYEQMVKKTVMRRLLKRLPIENEALAIALNRDEDEDQNERMADIIPLGDLSEGIETAHAGAKSTGDKLAAELNEKKKGKTTSQAPQNAQKEASSDGQRNNAEVSSSGGKTEPAQKTPQGQQPLIPTQGQAQKGAQQKPAEYGAGAEMSEEEKQALIDEERGSRVVGSDDGE